MTPEPPSSYTLHSNKDKHLTQTEQTIRSYASSPTPALVLSAMNLGLLPLARRRTLGVPSVMQCNMYTAIFAASAYALASGDSVNGSGLAAGWSTIWLFFNARNALKSRSLVPIAMTSIVGCIGSLYGYSYATYGYQ
ncbi:hypothetical protein H4R99_007333 [Coemansia sp. RSA 1722]|nr:hypothetical protein IWW45_005248 [Coemansia sp. RSA 485]KAJ2589808.1 hypothetical protein H4R99_007333 [Coemansia sp. RSA 1722]KAJ2600811.1 hypothetical protein GGF39_001575 [Coemansia sp. RSA 1721]